MINGGRQNALVSKLDGALAKLAKGQTKAAISQLQAAINQVRSFVDTGVLTEQQGDTLISAIEDILPSLL